MSLLSGVEPVQAVLSRPHGLLEGPRIAASGELVYSDVLAGGLWACDPAGAVTELLGKRRGIGGVVAHADGGWVISGRSILHVAPGGEQRELYSDASACGFNDLCTTSSGELLAGVLRYRPLAGEAPRDGELVLLGAGGGARVVTAGITWPNGIGLAPDGRTVYISDYARAAVLRASLDGGGAQVLCSSPRGSADGLAVDARGGVWVALGDGAGVARFEPDGSLDEVVDLPAGFVSSISFGGPDLRDVLISTADNRVEPQLGGTLLRARSEVPGLALAPATL